MMADASDIWARAGNRPWRPMLTALLCVVVAACGGTVSDTEGQIRAWIDRGHEAAENKDRGELVDMISPTYADTRGHSRDDIENLFRFYFLRTNNVALLVNVDDIEVIDDTAAAVKLTVGMGATTDSALGFNADAYQFALELENNGGEWLLVSGRWNDFGGELR
jgi:hypothetical protein